MFKNPLALAATVLGLSAIAVPASAAIVAFDFTSGDDGGFTTSGTPLWTYTGTQWQTNDQDNPGWGISSVSVDLPDAAAESVPEPSTVVALTMVGGSLLLRKRMKQG